MFGAIIPPSLSFRLTSGTKIDLGFSASDPVEAAVHCLEFSWSNSVIRHTCTGGVVCMGGDFACGHFISCKVCLIATISCAVINIATNSASEAEDMTNLIIFESVSTGPFHRGMASFSENKLCAPDLLSPLLSL